MSVIKGSIHFFKDFLRSMTPDLNALKSAISPITPLLECFDNKSRILSLKNI
jgi:hypothetical protein